MTERLGEQLYDDPALIGNTACPVCGTVPAQILWRTDKPTRFIHSDGTEHKDKSNRLTVDAFRQSAGLA